MPLTSLELGPKHGTWGLLCPSGAGGDSPTLPQHWGKRTLRIPRNAREGGKLIHTFTLGIKKSTNPMVD